jgi:hypothetical protein
MALITRVGCPSARARPERQRIDDGGQHAHVIGGDAIHVLGRGGDAAEDIAAAHHHADWTPAAPRLGQFSGEALTRSASMPKEASAGHAPRRSV